MGVVFAARHRGLGKKVAIKPVLPGVAAEDELIARFQQQARAASALGHPNIAQVFDLGSAPDGALYMVMEHLEGQSLAQLLEDQPLLTPERAVGLAAQVLSALAAAHRRGIVHRDLKPENVFITRDDDGHELVKLLDFGISKVLPA